MRLTQTPQNPIYIDFNGEILNKGKTYKEYLREEEARKREKFAALLREKQIQMSHPQEDVSFG